MKNKLHSFFKKYSKKQLILGVVGLLVVVFILFKIFGGSTAYTTVPVVRGSVEEEVLVTGKTESKTEVNLGFQTTGRVVQGSPDIGTNVSEGDVLAKLDQSGLLASAMKIQANIDQAQVELDATTRKSSVSNQSALNNLLLTLKDAYSKSDNAVKNVADQFFVNPQSSSPEFKPSFVDNGTTYYGNITDEVKISISGTRETIGEKLSAWKTLQTNLSATSDLTNQLKVAHQNLADVKIFLDKVSDAINTLSVSDYTYNLAKYNAVIDGYKNSVSSARTDILNVNSILISAEEKYSNAPQTTASGTYDDVLVDQAKLDSYKADKALNDADLSKTVIRSPISGIVTKSDAKRGEIVNAGESLVTVISENKLQIKANVSEVNISKVSVGDDVSIVFDAIPDTTYEGKILYIDPASVLVDGVATYKVTIGFVDDSVLNTPSPIRSGLTANLRITTRKVEGAIKVPAYAVFTLNGTTMVKVNVAGKSVDREVKTGLRGKDGTLEILSGLSEGENVEVTQTQ